MWRTLKLIPKFTNSPRPEEVIMETRDASPAHFLTKIESFSLLKKCDKYETSDFVAEDCKWRLVFYPNGKHGGGYVSVYLAMVDAGSNCQVDAVFSIFLFNQISGNYLYTQGRTGRFLGFKSEWGFSRFISKKFLRDPSKGYLIDDKCVFGAEIFVVKSQAIITECLSLKNPIPYKRCWNISNFSQLRSVWTEKFTTAGLAWRFRIYPRGFNEATGECTSIFLDYVNVKTKKVKACFLVKIINQFTGKQHEQTVSHWFMGIDNSCGWTSFIELADMDDPSKGFVVNDCCHLETEISLQAVVTY